MTMKLLQVTSIEYDFDCEDGTQSIPRAQQDHLTQTTIGKVYEVEDEDYLADAISDETGWCIKSLEYEVVNEVNEGGDWFNMSTDENGWCGTY